MLDKQANILVGSNYLVPVPLIASLLLSYFSFEFNLFPSSSPILLGPQMNQGYAALTSQPSSTLHPSTRSKKNCVSFANS
jgi:hypothetical protein